MDFDQGRHNTNAVSFDVGEILERRGHRNPDVDVAVAMVPLNTDRDPVTFLNLSIHEHSTYWNLKAHVDIMLNFHFLKAGSFAILKDGLNRL